MTQKSFFSAIIFCLLFFMGRSQDVAYNDVDEISYVKAYSFAYDGNHKSAQEVLVHVLESEPDNIEAQSLLASTLSWSGKYAAAREQFNKITSIKRSNREIWISAIKNELYAKNYTTALGLSNKSLYYLKKDKEVERLRQIALKRIEDKKYPEQGWFNQTNSLKTSFAAEKKQKKNKTQVKKEKKGEEVKKDKETKKSTSEEVPKNRFSIRNSFTLFDQRYDPIVNSSISFKHQTKYGSIIPKINYSSRVGKQGLQYDISLYPKLAKRMYAFLNYGYSSAQIYPNHRFAGDVYKGLPGAIEISAGSRCWCGNT